MKHTSKPQTKPFGLVIGKLTCHPTGYGFVMPENRGAGEPDIYVAKEAIREAMHGDRVAVQVERQTAKGLEGRIVRVVERGQQRMVGRYESDGKFGGHVVPFDRRVLRELRVPAGDDARAPSGWMVLAEIVRPPTATRPPVGRGLEVLGKLEDPGVDLKVVMAKYALPDSFPAEVEQQARRVPQTVSAADVVGRTDFRPWTTVTVDPETARDHDDAISLDKLGNGHWLLAVHIADVAHYVPEGSPLDSEAYLRGTSIYFPDRVVPMLPHALSSGICSLVDGQDRLTQTVVLELDPDGRVLRAEFHDGVIKSAARMSYQQVQSIVSGDAALRARFEPLVPLFERMDDLAKRMRRRRYERGSLDFDLPEPKLVLSAAGEMTGIIASERLDSMRAIEEFMLAANEAVARHLVDAGAPALHRVHEAPDPERVSEFCELVASFGYRIPENLEEFRPQDFQMITRQIEGKPEEKLVSYLLLRTMKLARYFEESLGHFGLAASEYTHFTSPIRRYPDLVVHRALRALRHGGDPKRDERKAVLAEWGVHLSECERRADDAERELIEWKKVRFMADKVGEVFEGYVTGVQAFGLFVELKQVFVQGLVHVSTMGDDYYVFNERAHQLKGQSTNRVFRLGDPVKVQVARVDLERRQIDFALLGVKPRAASRPSASPRGKSKPRAKERSSEPRKRSRRPRVKRRH